MHTILVQKPEGKRLCGWPRHGWVDNIKIYPKGMGGIWNLYEYHFKLRICNKPSTSLKMS